MTAVVNNTVIWRAATTAEHYNWIKRVSDLFTAVGFVKHTDTGQIDLSGTTVPLGTPATTTYVESGFEIRKLVAAGKPTMYCRVGYGFMVSGAATPVNLNNCPVIRMQWSTATDGAGNLSGQTLPPMMTNRGYVTAESPTLTQRPFYAASDGANYLTMCFDPANVGSGTPSTALIICNAAFERTIDADTGLYDADGFVYVHSNNDNVTGGVAPNFNKAIMNYSLIDLATNIVSSASLLTPSQGTTLFSNSGVAGVTPLFPITVMIPKIKAPMRAALAYFWNDITDGTSFSTTVYGGTQTMITGGRWTTGTIMPVTTSYRLALRYD